MIPEQPNEDEKQVQVGDQKVHSMSRYWLAVADYRQLKLREEVRRAVYSLRDLCGAIQGGETGLLQQRCPGIVVWT